MKEDLSKSKSNFVRIGAQPPNTDIKTYDIGNLWIISQGVGTPQATLGELYVEYTVKLMTPVYESLSDLVPTGGSFTAGGAMSGINPLGTIPVASGANDGILLDGLSNITITQPGTYLVYLSSVGTGITAGTLTPDIHSVVGTLQQVVDAGGLFVIAIYQVIVSEPSLISYALTATTVSAGQAYLGTAPTGSL